MRLALITDIHEDIVSLHEALRIIGKSNVDEIACLGDISGFSAPHYDYLDTRNAHECLRLIRENCNIILIGNHDMHAAQILPENCPFFDFPDNWYQLDYHDRYEMAKEILWFHEEYDLDPLYKHEDREFLRTLSDYCIFNTPNGDIFLSHYVYPNLSGLKSEFFTYADEFHKHFSYAENKGCKLSFTGHSHVKGFFMATKKRYQQFRYTRKDIPDKPTCIGIPPVTSNGKKSGFCIFDTSEQTIQSIRI